MNADGFKDHVRWSYVASDAVAVGAAPPTEPPRQPQFRYDGAKRSLEIRLDAEDAAYRDVVVELLDGIAATDGARLKPWTLRFSFGGQ
jgi:hypothetical protein